MANEPGHALGINPEIFNKIETPPIVSVDTGLAGDGIPSYAKLDVLIAYLTAPTTVNYDTLTEFLMTFRMFTTQKELWQLLASRLLWAADQAARNGSELETGNDIGTRCFVLMRMWIRDYFASDFAPSLELRETVAESLTVLSGCTEFVLMEHFQRILIQLRREWDTQISRIWVIPSGVAGNTDARVPAGGEPLRTSLAADLTTNMTTIDNQGNYDDAGSPIPKLKIAGVMGSHILSGEIPIDADIAVPSIMPSPQRRKPKNKLSMLFTRKHDDDGSKREAVLHDKVDMLAMELINEYHMLERQQKSPSSSDEPLSPQNQTFQPEKSFSTQGKSSSHTITAEQSDNAEHATLRTSDSVSEISQISARNDAGDLVDQNANCQTNHQTNIQSIRRTDDEVEGYADNQTDQESESLLRGRLNNQEDKKSVQQVNHEVAAQVRPVEPPGTNTTFPPALRISSRASTKGYFTPTIPETASTTDSESSRTSVSTDDSLHEKYSTPTPSLYDEGWETPGRSSSQIWILTNAGENDDKDETENEKKNENTKQEVPKTPIKDPLMGSDETEPNMGDRTRSGDGLDYSPISHEQSVDTLNMNNMALADTSADSEDAVSFENHGLASIETWGNVDYDKFDQVSYSGSSLSTLSTSTRSVFSYHAPRSARSHSESSRTISLLSEEENSLLQPCAGYTSMDAERLKAMPDFQFDGDALLFTLQKLEGTSPPNMNFDESILPPHVRDSSSHGRNATSAHTISSGIPRSNTAELYSEALESPDQSTEEYLAQEVSQLGIMSNTDRAHSPEGHAMVVEMRDEAYPDQHYEVSEHEPDHLYTGDPSYGVHYAGQDYTASAIVHGDDEPPFHNEKFQNQPGLHLEKPYPMDDEISSPMGGNFPSEVQRLPRPEYPEEIPTSTESNVSSTYLRIQRNENIGIPKPLRRLHIGLPGATHAPFILAYSARAVAEQMTLIECQIANQLDLPGLIGMSWPKPIPKLSSWLQAVMVDSPLKGTALVAARSDLVCRWAQSEILLCPTPALQAQSISRFVHIAFEALRLQNFATMTQLVLAVSSSTVSSQLSEDVFKLFPQHDRETLDRLERLASSNNNHSKLMNAHRRFSWQKGCVPFIPMFLNDIEVTAEASSQNAEQEIHFGKYRVAAQLVKSLEQCLQSGANYDIKPEPALLSKCLYLAAIPDL